MADVREDIMARLLELAVAIPIIRFAKRGEIGVNDIDLPAALILDGNETTSDENDLSMHPANKPTNVRMTPEIMLIHQNPNIGSEMNALRQELVKSILNDAELNEQIVKTGRNGTGVIRYLGCETGYANLRNLNGVLIARFLFKYALKPWEL
jgi:hypothetical protein